MRFLGTARLRSHDSRRDDLATAHRLARLAVRSLYAELVLYPKPGLVSLRDNGSHSDMNAELFMRSLFALRRYFVEIAIAGMRSAIRYSATERSISTRSIRPASSLRRLAKSSPSSSLSRLAARKDGGLA